GRGARARRKSVAEEQPQCRWVSTRALRVHLSGLQPLPGAGRRRTGGAGAAILRRARARGAGRATAALESVGLGRLLHQKPAELSGGEKQRVAIARALAKSPALIFADEPTSALDSGNGQIVIRLLHQAAKERNAAVVVVTHDPRLEGHADRIIGLEDGRIVNDRM